MRTLILATGTFDQVNTFNVNYGRGVKRAQLHRDYQKQGDGVYWAMSSGACIKSSYTDADRAETARLNSEPAIKNGDVVLIDGEEYTARVLGDYSDCAIFDKK